MGKTPVSSFAGNGKTAVLLLEDIRPGDIIDYAYSIDGSNPALDGMFTDRVALQFQEPVNTW